MIFVMGGIVNNLIFKNSFLVAYHTYHVVIFKNSENYRLHNRLDFEWCLFQF
jgi:hypothetical protein